MTLTHGRKIAEHLDVLAGQDVSVDELVAVLSDVKDIDTLWEVARSTPPYISIARAIYRRAIELGGSEDRARGQMALAHLFCGDTETAAAIVGQSIPETSEWDLLLAWASLCEDHAQHLERLRLVLKRVEDPLPVWRQIWTVAMGRRDAVLGKEAYDWLIQHEVDPRNIEAINRGWQIMVEGRDSNR